MSLISIVLLTKYHWSFGPPSQPAADEEMEPSAAMYTMCVAPCGAIPCIFRQCAEKDDHNEKDYNKDDHTKIS